jgi:predicted Zn-dependent protease
MGFLKIFSGKTPEEHEQKGDSLFKASAVGDAKLEYEAGLHKLEKKDPDNSDLRRRLQKKIFQSREALALHHKKRGEEMMESQYYEGAEDVFRLALELTESPELISNLQALLKELEDHYAEEETTDDPEIQFENTDTQNQDLPFREDEYFSALCGSFSDKEREKAYRSYGDAFREGFLALNQGDFTLAAAKLSQAVEENPAPKTYIPLELAAAYLNLGKNEEARDLLSSFLNDFPDSLQGYQLLCEAYWEMKEFGKAQELLQNCSRELGESPHILLLKGETLYQSGNFQEAETLFMGYLESSPWSEEIALSLARTCEALGEKEKACNLYGRIMDECTGCGRQVSPFIKRRYSDISLECGQASPRILELYLSLVQEDPENKGDYYQKIIEIYSAQGNEKEARRYQSLAEKTF